jgi:hypothetical protein
MSEQCEHLDRNPEGVEWSDNDALGHFLNCLSETQKVEYWVHLRRFADTGRVCGMQDHPGVIESQRRYIADLLVELRGLQAARDIAAAFPSVDPGETLAAAITSDIKGARGMAEGFRGAGEKLKGVEW